MAPEPASSALRRARWARVELEAFSDGVIAIIITIMVLEMKVPYGENLRALLPLLPVFLTWPRRP